jgi:hypothetical protein
MHFPPLPIRQYSWYSCLLRGWVDPRAIVGLEGLYQWVIPVTPLEIEQMVLWLVAQCLKALSIRGSFKKALSLCLSMNVALILVAFSAHPALVITPGSLCRYAEGRPRSCKWRSGALLGWLISCYIFINPHMSLRPYQLDPVVFCQFHQGLMTVPDKFGIYLGTVWGLAQLVDKLFHIHQSPYVLAPIPVGSCCVLPVSSGIDGSPWQIWNLFGNSQGPCLASW